MALALVVKNNMSAQNTLNRLKKNSSNLEKSLKKVASGMKINSAADDASGLSISERMRVQVRGLDQAQANTQNATSLMRTAEGAVQSTIDTLRTMKEKAINAANDHNTDADRATLQREIDQLVDQVDDNASVQFNGRYLFDGTADVAYNTEGTIIKALNTEWIPNSLSLIEQTYGITFNEANTKPKDMNVVFSHQGSRECKMNCVSYR